MWTTLFLPYFRLDISRLTLACRLNTLDISLEKTSCQEVDRYFRESQGMTNIAKAFNRYLGDEEGLRALKKGFHIIYEGRTRTLGLRLDPPEQYGLLPIPEAPVNHPIDVHLKAELERLTPDARTLDVSTSLWGRTVHRLLVVTVGLALVLRSLRILFQYGAASVEPVKGQVAAPNYGAKDMYLPIIQAAKDQGLWREKGFVVVTERDEALDLDDPHLAVLHPSELRVPRREWFQRVVIPGWRLFFSVIGIVFISRRDALSTQVGLDCFRQALNSLEHWRVAMNLRCPTLLTLGEAEANHIIRRAIFHKYGSRLVRWPNTHYDSWSVICSYQSYDVFYSGGSYEWETFRGSWRPGLRYVPLGKPQSDRRNVTLNNRMSPELSSYFEQQFAQGKKMAAFFSPSPYKAIMPIYMENLFLLCRQAAGRDDWVFVIKPKGQRKLKDLAALEPRFAPYLDLDNIIWLGYESKDPEYCPPGWLVDKMTFGVGDPSTIMTETLSSGKSFFARYTLTSDTPLRAKLVEDGYLMEDADKFEATLKNALDDPDGLPKPSETYKTWFDPYQDDDALGRLASEIFSPDGKEVIPSFS